MVKATAGEIAPKGDQHALCVFVEDMGMQQFMGDGKWKRKVCFFFELDVDMEDGRPFMLSKSYTLSLHPKATLAADIQRWKDEEFTAKELAEGVDLDTYIGKTCTLEVIHKLDKEGAPRAKIDRIKPPAEGAPKLTAHNKEPPAWAAERKAANDADYAAYRAGEPLPSEAKKDGPLPF